ncbi:F-box/kelch-repeat protein-like protein [Drosera capensis]
MFEEERRWQRKTERDLARKCPKDPFLSTGSPTIVKSQMILSNIDNHCTLKTISHPPRGSFITSVLKLDPTIVDSNPLHTVLVLRPLPSATTTSRAPSNSTTEHPHLLSCLRTKFSQASHPKGGKDSPQAYSKPLHRSVERLKEGIMHHKKWKSILPDELVDEILLSQRAKTLLRLQCVCKSWHDKIQSPAFIKQHVERSSIVSISFSSSSPRAYIIHPVKIRYVVTRYLAHSTWTIFLSLSAFTLPVDPDTKIYIDIVGACNGLVCYVLNNDKNDGNGWIFLFNPSTRSHMLITAPQGMVFGIRAPVTTGFGYDNINDDYVVVTYLYSLKSNSWEEHKSNCPLLFNDRLTYIQNGASATMAYLSGICDNIQNVVLFGTLPCDDD